MKTKIAFFDAKEYDIASFDAANANGDYKIKYFETKLSPDTVDLAKGYDCVCVFVNDDVGAPVIDRLEELGVRLIALRCAGYNNVDIEHAFGKVHVAFIYCLLRVFAKPIL